MVEIKKFSKNKRCFLKSNGIKGQALHAKSLELYTTKKIDEF